MAKSPKPRRARRSGPKLSAETLPNAAPVRAAPTIAPQLATVTTAVPVGEEWLHEIKFDGYRLMCYVHKGTVRLITRGGHDWTAKYREIADAIAKLDVSDAVLDGELIALDYQGRATFNAMQSAMLAAAKSRRLQLHLFDLPYCDGFDLRRSPLIDRKRLLKHLLAEADDPLHYSDHVIGRGDEVFRQACQRRLEGIISKRVDSHYVSSRTSSWLKNKCKHRQEVVIGGYSDPEGKRKGFGALLAGVYEGDKLVYCGRVGTGFDEAALAPLTKRLSKLKLTKSAFDVPPTRVEAKGAHWVKPLLVAEVEFGEWTDDHRLRHPVFLGLRTDKPATQVVRERADINTPVVAATDSIGGKFMSGATVSDVALSNPDRMLYPKAKVTKRDLAEFYETIAKWILPHIVNRPLTIVRCPKGLPNKCFYQRHLNETLPPTLRGVRVREGSELVQYIVLDNLAGLISLVQLSTLEIHPWGSMADDVERPNRLIFDLDPGPGVPWKRVVEAARTTRDILAAAELQSFVQTSGGKGLHVVVPIVARAGWDEAKAFCKAVAQLMASREPTKYTATLSKSRREGKVFVDYLRNGRGATSVASYSSRARDTASVATPLTWAELPGLRRANGFSVRNLPRRLDALKADPWESFFTLRQQLPTPGK